MSVTSLKRPHAIILAGTVITLLLVLVLTYTIIPTYKSEVSKENRVNAIEKLDRLFEQIDRNALAPSHVINVENDLLDWFDTFNKHDMSTTSNTTYLNEGRDQTKQRKDNQKVILFWTEFYSMIPTALNQTFFDRCQESNCVATMDRARLQEADAVVFFLFSTNWLPGDLPDYRFPWQFYVAWMYEPAAYPWVSKHLLRLTLNPF